MVECTLWEQLQARRQRNQINSILSCIFWFLFSRRMVSVVIVRVRWKSENKSSLLADTSFGGLFEHSSRYLMSFAFTDQRSHGRHQLFLWFTQLWIFTEKYSAFPVTSINLRHFFFGLAFYIYLQRKNKYLLQYAYARFACLFRLCGLIDASFHIFIRSQVP